MSKSCIITVLDYIQNEVDIFQVFVPETEEYEDEIEFLEGVVEERGHHLESSHWMFSEPNQFKFKVDL